MSISEKDVKKLWGLAAGICSFPGCDTDCIQFVDADDPTLVGEMAHIIAKKQKGRRGKPGGGSNDYTNLILLCPTHHTLVDKAPEGKFSELTLLDWKRNHEEAVRRRLVVPEFSCRKGLAQYVLRLLIDNEQTWVTYGPESHAALSDPLSNMARQWTLRKISHILPKNRLVADAVQRNSALFSPAEYRLCAEFVEHASGFERSAYERLDSVPRFPKQFEEMISRVADE
jgi:hypothetical protein